MSAAFWCLPLIDRVHVASDVSLPPGAQIRVKPMPGCHNFIFVIQFHEKASAATAAQPLRRLDRGQQALPICSWHVIYRENRQQRSHPAGSSGGLTPRAVSVNPCFHRRRAPPHAHASCADPSNSCPHGAVECRILRLCTSRFGYQCDTGRIQVCLPVEGRYGVIRTSIHVGCRIPTVVANKVLTIDNAQPRAHARASPRRRLPPRHHRRRAATAPARAYWRTVSATPSVCFVQLVHEAAFCDVRQVGVQSSTTMQLSAVQQIMLLVDPACLRDRHCGWWHEVLVQRKGRVCGCRRRLLWAPAWRSVR